MFAPEIKIEKFEMMDVITTSGEVDDCPTDAALPCVTD